MFAFHKAPWVLEILRIRHKILQFECTLGYFLVRMNYHTDTNVADFRESK